VFFSAASKHLSGVFAQVSPAVCRGKDRPVALTENVCHTVCHTPLKGYTKTLFYVAGRAAMGHLSYSGV